ncbi:MAG: Omp28-related outer membrane protein [Chitinophagales bacterium]
MKNTRIKKFGYLIISSSLIFVFINSCTEVGPAIDLTETVYDTYIETPELPQDKIVLIEDFTGAACPNCPTAHEAIAAVIDAHPDRVAAIAEYNYFADPLYLDQNFVTSEALNLDQNYLGPVAGWPASFIDRVDFDDDGYAAEVPGNIMPYTEDQLAKTPTCNIYILPDYNAATRELNLTVTIKYIADVSLTNHLSVALTEDSIIAAQIDGAGEVPDYVHNHVLRKMLSFYTGDALPEINSPGRVYVFNYNFTLPAGWNENNIQAIAFVHNFETDNKEVVQAGVTDIN